MKKSNRLEGRRDLRSGVLAAFERRNEPRQTVPEVDFQSIESSAGKNGRNEGLADRLVSRRLPNRIRPGFSRIALILYGDVHALLY